MVLINYQLNSLFRLQVRNVRKKMNAIARFQPPIPILGREYYESKLTRVLERPPAVPMVLVGLDGVGKSFILKKVLHG
jgi:ATP-dependent Clp protease ATP-binding subunit ClpA